MKMQSSPACNAAEPASQRCLRSNTLRKRLKGSPESEAGRKPLQGSYETRTEQTDEVPLNHDDIKTVKVAAERPQRLTANGLLRRYQRKRREPKKTPAEKIDSEIHSSPARDPSCMLLSSDSPFPSQSTTHSLASTPKRGRRQAWLIQGACVNSTPDHNSSTDDLFTVPVSPLRPEQEELENTPISSQSETSEVVSTKTCRTPRKPRAAAKTAQPRRGRKGKPKKQPKNNGPPAKRQLRKGENMEEGASQRDTATKPPQRCRPRFELQDSDPIEQDRLNQEETSLSSDLSIELNQHEDELASFSIQEEEEEEEDDDELPSFLMQPDKKPTSITEGMFVWCKFRNYPFWPAMVKSVNRKMKKASIIFVDGPVIDKKRKGLTVALKTLKPFDCEEANQLVCTAKEKHDAVIGWSLDLIEDYRMRIACGSFTGSCVDYLAHDMSYPVRKKYPQGESERLTIPSQTEDQGEEIYLEESSGEQQQQRQEEEVSRSSTRLLPDRTHAAHNRANEKLVHFIVNQRMVEPHLLAVIGGQQQSRWLHSFLRANRRQVVDIYIEDDEQLDQVYRYLNKVYDAAPATAPCLARMKFMERVRFVLDVLLPEAIIYAIAGVDNMSVKKAEEKYLKGRHISNRERQEFDQKIEQQMRLKSVLQNTVE
ncbi:PWWP domain-containing DNA repair factor 3A isoform 2-T2 [Polymixia lowei]